ncbi:PhzF family phenazine biosynthesis protein [Nocardiopsis ganjiahuensis]|uniref:PhzF family phenazine biosynthesis protein n=1 Tax=Nocardiopsis ganjiahuensis TaxID=239984 RepID=UPI00034C7D5B|nr:PhzF family phenazine biosynthesis protein [Nocardiopsis ganjiahuensis]
MSTQVPFALVDVFASEPLTGNPLALIPDADGIGEQRMRAIAREFNQSETTFLVAPTLPGAHRRLRSFTPAGAEVLGAGHNAMGAWIWLADTGRLPVGQEAFAQQIGQQVLPVRVTRQPGQRAVVSMDQSPPAFGRTVADRQALAGALGLGEGDLVAEAPAQVVSTGAGHLLVPVTDRAAVDRVAPEPARLLRVLREVGGEGCYVYSRDPVDAAGGSVVYTRFFNPTVGIVEDPATGTAAGPLVAALTEAGQIPDGVDAIVEQGHALGRPSRLRVTVRGQLVRLSGSGLVVADGVLHL